MADPFASFDIACAIPAPYIPGKTKPRGASLTLPASMSEVDIFALLVWKFDRPNGIMTLLGERDGDSEGIFKWDFTFKTADGLEVWIQRTWMNLEVFTQGRAVSQNDVLEFFRSNLERYSGLVAAVRSELELHKLVINPYVRHKRMAEHAADQLKNCTVPPIWYPPSGMTVSNREHIDRHANSQQEHLRAADHESFMSVVLVSESAFMIEALINLLMAFLLKDVIRDTKPVFDEALRRGWKSKIQHLAVTCDHVSKTPDLADDRIRKASKVFELRNRIAHAYPDPSNLSVGEIYFLKRFPVLEHPVPFDGFQMNTDRLLPTKAEALEVHENAKEMRGYLLEQVDEWHRDEMDIVIEASPLGFNTKTQRYSMVFAGRGIAKLFLNGEEREDDAQGGDGPAGPSPKSDTDRAVPPGPAEG